MAEADGLTAPLGELLRVGEEPDRGLLDRVRAHGEAAVRPLIDIALDEELHNAPADSPLVWAPIHAIHLLGELCAVEAIEPLLRLAGEYVYDEHLSTALPEAFAGIGPAALAPLRALLFDRSKDIWARMRAASSLSRIAQAHPETRAEVLDALVARLASDQTVEPDDEVLNAFVVNDLGDLEANECALAVWQAYEEDRVDTWVISPEDACEKLDLPPLSEGIEPAPPGSLNLRLRCTACRYERAHRVPIIYYDLGTHDRRERGEEVTRSEYVIPQRIVCPKCGAVDQYELGAAAYMAMTAEVLEAVVAKKLGKPDSALEDGPLQAIRFCLVDGREMHPLDALDMYRQRVSDEPDDAVLRVRYGNVLGHLGYLQEAVLQYQ